MDNSYGVKTMEKYHNNDDHRTVFYRFRSFNEKFAAQESDILLGNNLFFSNIRKVDDIFEGLPIYKWRDDIPSHADTLALVNRNAIGMSKNDRKDLAAKIRQNLKSALARDINRSWIQYDYEKLFESSSVCCFSCDIKDPRYWALYASTNTGYALVFDFSLPWTMEAFAGHPAIPMVPMPVEYAENSRPVVPISLTKGNEDGFGDIRAALLTKSSAWSFQNEYRLFRISLQEGQVSFPATSLRAIVMGQNISHSNRSKLCNLINQRELPLRLYVAKASNTHYDYDLIEVQKTSGEGGIYV